MRRNRGDPPGKGNGDALRRRRIHKPINTGDNYTTGSSVSPLSFEHPRFDPWLWHYLRSLQAANSLLGGGSLGWFYIRRGMVRFCQWVKYGHEVSRYQCWYNVQIANQYVSQLAGVVSHHGQN
jgi:hypothetical protein